MPNSRFLFITLLTSFVSLFASPTQAQLIPDQTLGAESSVVTSGEIGGLPGDRIEGGATRGTNLFHSFSSFNIEEAQRVYFDSPAGIESILSRVTGGNLSTIDGLLGTTGNSNAALILVNPNGIVFGENASLDVQGAFTATTASGVQLGESGSFSAIAPESDSLLSINPSAFFFSEQAVRPEILVEASQSANGGLFVPAGQTLLLLGGDVVLDGGNVTARGGNVMLGAIASAGTVSVNDNDIAIDSDIERGDIRLENAAVVDVQGAIGGGVVAIADNIDILPGSFVIGGVQPGLGSPENQSGSLELTATGSIAIGRGAIVGTLTSGKGSAGNLIITATETLSLDGGILISSISENGRGSGGDITITAENLYATANGFVTTTISGEGDAGDISLDIAGTARFEGVTAVSSIAIESSVGEGGRIEIVTNSLEIIDGAGINTATFNENDAGAIVINAAKSVRISGANPERGIASFVGSNTLVGTGRGGDVEISAANLEVSQGGFLSSSTSGMGESGNLVLSISETVLVDGSEPAALLDGRLSPSFIRTGTISEMQSGDIEISAANLNVINGGSILASTIDEGDAGNIVLNISERARIDGVSSQTGTPSAVISTVNSGASGQGGNIEILATDLDVTNGALIDASTEGEGDAGNVVLDISEMAYLGAAGSRVGGVFSSVDPGGEGDGGNVELTAANLTVTDGAVLSTSTFGGGSGDAGRVVLNIRETARFDGVNPITNSASGAYSSIEPNGEGNGGNLELTANNLEISDNAQLTASNLESGDAGDINLTVVEQVKINNGAVITASQSGSGGQINIRAGGMVLRDDGDIQTNVASGEGSGGNITLSSDYVVAIADSDILAFSADGRGGDIDLSQTTLFAQNLSRVVGELDSEDLSALDGNDRVDINATGRLESGTISVSDSSFVENSLAELSDTLADTDALVASSCIASRDDAMSSLTVRRGDRPTQSPTSPLPVPYSLGTVQPVPTAEPANIQEPQGIYQLNDGRLVISRRCE